MLNIPVGDTLAIRMNAGMIDNDGIVDYPHVYELDSNGDPVVNGDVITATPVYTSVKDVDDVDIKYGRVSALFTPNDDFQRPAFLPAAGGRSWRPAAGHEWRQSRHGRPVQASMSSAASSSSRPSGRSSLTALELEVGSASRP